MAFVTYSVWSLTNSSLLPSGNSLSISGMAAFTPAATSRLLSKAGANVTSAAVVLELAALGGRDLLEPLPVSSLHTA